MGCYHHCVQWVITVAYCAFQPTYCAILCSTVPCLWCLLLTLCSVMIPSCHISYHNALSYIYSVLFWYSCPLLCITVFQCFITVVYCPIILSCCFFTALYCPFTIDLFQHFVLFCHKNFLLCIMLCCYAILCPAILSLYSIESIIMLACCGITMSCCDTTLHFCTTIVLSFIILVSFVSSLCSLYHPLCLNVPWVCSTCSFTSTYFTITVPYCIITMPHCFITVDYFFIIMP